jgi:molybdate transport system regulatory protein
MKLSARNTLKGTVESIKEGAVNGVVTIKIGNETVTADITMDSIEGLGLKNGVEAYAVVKASNVMFAAGSERLTNLSARNQIAGKVIEVKEGAVNGHVTIESGDIRITGSITNEAIKSLGLEVGSDAVAVIKATDVMVGVEH